MKRVCMLMLLGCGGSSSVDDDWDRVQSRCGTISFATPIGVAPQPAVGEDSCVDRYVGDGCELTLDWGGFSDRLDSYTEEPNYAGSDERIDGKAAKVVRYRCGTLYCAGVNLPRDVEPSLTLFARCETISGQDTALQILRSVRLD